MGVLTTKEFGEKSKNKTGEPLGSPVIPSRKVKEIKRRVLFPDTIMGKSQTTISFKGKPLKIIMMDKIYTFPKEMDKPEEKELFSLLISLGFKDASITIFENGKEEEKPESKQNNTEPKYEIVYKIGHPDNTKEIKFNGKVHAEIAGIPVPFECKNGMVETKSKPVYDSFIKKGWYSISVEEVEVKSE